MSVSVADRLVNESPLAVRHSTKTGAYYTLCTIRGTPSMDILEEAGRGFLPTARLWDQVGAAGWTSFAVSRDHNRVAITRLGPRQIQHTSTSLLGCRPDGLRGGRDAVEL
jgi:hypothetical protein